uniref:Putative alkylated dna repair protein alkb log 1 n=1 Tax=Triatoma dimidiata TaxID=72491 RepID=A0A0V0G4T0_TRIDM
MFKQVFKKYKCKCSPVDLDSALDFNNLSPEDDVRICEIKVEESLCEFEKLGLTSPSEWRIFHVISQPGLIIVKNIFSWKGQRMWIKKCLAEYPLHPNKTNLDVHGLILPSENWWHVCQTDLCRRQVLYKKLRWITLGYHHNWDTKEYCENTKSPVPQELIDLCRVCARSIGGWNFTAQAAIINFYHLGSTLSGHVDRSEPNEEAPLLSFSFGGRAVFLIGDADDEEHVTALVLESGDLVIMSGQSRLAMHGVPKVMPPLQPYPWTDSTDQTLLDNEEWNSSFEEYISSARININVRQVLHPGQRTLS